MIPKLKPIRPELLDHPSFQQALTLAGEHAADVDRNGRFPSEAIEALRAAGAMSWLVPRELGGAGASLDEAARAVFELSRRCASTGMIFAMHQIQIGCITRHAVQSPWFADYLKRLVREQRLIASATSELGTGGDIRRSIAAIHPAPGAEPFLRFEKKATTISYGASADDLLTTVRRAPDSEPGDQVLVLTHISEMKMKQTDQWDTLGMRGTCSPGFELEATFAPDHILPAPFATISAETMVPFSHILWSHVWLGLSSDAFDRAQNFVRKQARQTPGTTPPSALRLSELSVHMAQFRAMVESALDEYVELTARGDRAALSTVGFAVRINNLKISASEAAVEACLGALRVCGVSGYKNDGPFSIGRNLRDAHSAALMIANDRLYSTNASLLLVHREGK
ncbi:MAG TPA: acyl-CoA dehydrogenase family protein [Bryobacteraceae bacterium]|jgi:acyl-CoA dehydrogenase|nr:acyl-CoA dehydrogenase family protein [Bryobacteraceae bacterium]